MNDYSLRAFYATLFAICYLVTVAGVLAYFKRYSEAIGVGAATTGLIGVMQVPKSRSAGDTKGTGDE